MTDQWSEVRAGSAAPAPGPLSAPPAPPTGPVSVPPLAYRAPRPRRWPTVLAAIALVCALMFAGTAAGAAEGKILAERRTKPDATLFLAGISPRARDAAVTAILTRRAQAVRTHNRAAFLADVDPTDRALVARQSTLYANLVKLSFSAFVYTLEKAQFDLRWHADLLARYHKIVYVPGVTLRYRIAGVDTGDVALPYVPIFGRRGNRWLLAGEATDNDVDATVPFGIGTQPWEGDPIDVRRSAHAVLVYSPADAKLATDWLNLVERAVARVRDVRPGHWSGSVFVVAVRDRKLITAYEGSHVDKIAAIAVRRFDRVRAWSPGPASYAGTVVLFNPTELNRDDQDLSFVLTHEITHAAMDPVTSDSTPLWLVEGFADYVAYRGYVLSPDWARKHLSGRDLSQLPANGTFYADDTNYTLGELACQTVADRYGEARLIRLYEAFATSPGDAAADDAAVRATLGESLAQLTGQWRQTVDGVLHG